MPTSSSQQPDTHNTQIETIGASLRDEQPERIVELLSEMHPAEIAHLLESLPVNQREKVWPYVPDDTDGEILLHLMMKLVPPSSIKWKRVNLLPQPKH